ncbi:hypothetical protein ILT44_11550 [Microvirga sp. BT689]|uniref:hypothetical protein n=1 Tax=Microvirga arvi TaxID=2778731 RepID=UPI00194F02AD|nr:hypothetical protein [Microvirga arvi]MBM6580819.1 hypothetical protein [Microvirga arvi]
MHKLGGDCWNAEAIAEKGARNSAHRYSVLIENGAVRNSGGAGVNIALYAQTLLQMPS